MSFSHLFHSEFYKNKIKLILSFQEKIVHTSSNLLAVFVNGRGYIQLRMVNRLDLVISIHG